MQADICLLNRERGTAQFLLRMNSQVPLRHISMEKEYQWQNIKMLEELTKMTIFIAVVNWLIQLLYHDRIQNMALATIFIAWTFITSCGIHYYHKISHPRMVSYCLQTVALLFVMIQAVYFGRSRDLIIFLIMILCFPTLLIDDTKTIMAYTCSMSALYIVFDALRRPLMMTLNDAIYIAGFTVMALSVAVLGNKQRRLNIENTCKIKKMVRVDYLTGLNNRQALEEDQSQYYGTRKGIFCADLDNLRLINEIYGHVFGDEVIKKFSALFVKAVKGHVYRYHDDMFLAIVEATQFSQEDAFQTLSEGMKHISVDEGQVQLFFSAAYIHGDLTGKEAFDECLRDVDFALKEGKASGKLTAYSLNEASRIYDEHYIEHRLSLFNGDELTHMLDMNTFGKAAKSKIRKMKSPVIVYMNMRDFKDYNEHYGRESGDVLLRLFAKRIHKIFDQDLASRSYADHFYILSEEGTLEQRLEMFMAQVKHHNMMSLSLDIGIDQMGKEEDVFNACDNAKFAANHIKANRALNIQYFDERLAQEKTAIAYIDAHFEEALAHHDIQVFYQPIVRSVSGLYCNAEALSRWQRASDLLSPVQYIPLLEASHLIYKLDLYVLDQVLSDITRQQREGHHLVPVSINLSGHDFEDCDMVSEIIQRVDKAQVPHQMIVIEITESVFVSSVQMNDILTALHEHGFQVWMDDFGSGYSSLNMLQSVPVDLVKLDMKFMKDFDENEASRMMVADIIKMAARLGIDTLAEGVETKSAYDQLKGMGCTKIQGYYISKPVPLSNLMEKQNNLNVEKDNEVSYYDAIGRVSLANPFSLYSFNTSLAVKVPPTAILELVDDATFYVLRANKEYYKLIQDVDFTKDGVKLTQPLSDQFMKGLYRCFESQNWESIIRSPEHGFYMNSLVHFISNEKKGHVAFIIYITYIQKIAR
jgi:diguanylate cyclase (GGDEF)-like protein